MKTYHTPGPWVGQTGHRATLIRGIHAQGGRLVVRFGGIAAPTSVEGQANAHLIAAAPELLAALQAVMAEWRDGYGLKCHEQCRSALVRAGAA